MPVTVTPRHHNPDVAADVIVWGHPDDAEDIVDALAETYDIDAYFDGDVAGTSGPTGQDWGSLTIETRHGALQLAPLDALVIYPGRSTSAPRVTILSTDQLRTTYLPS